MSAQRLETVSLAQRAFGAQPQVADTGSYLRYLSVPYSNAESVVAG